MAFLIGSGIPPAPISSFNMAREAGPCSESMASDSETSSSRASGKRDSISRRYAQSAARLAALTTSKYSSGVNRYR